MLPVIMRGHSRISRPARIVAVLLILLISLTASTQATAWRLGYQEALGAHFNYFYAPWKIISWTLNWYDQNPSLFIGCGSVGVCVAGILLLFLTMALSRMMDPGTDYLHGSARWADKKDIKRANLFVDDGVYVGGWEDAKGRLHYLRHNGSEHILCIAPTRSGKGVCLVIPTLLTWMHSCVITDLKGELWAYTAGWRNKQARNKVLLFEPAAEKGSIGWNPMEEIRLGTAYEISDAQNLATMIVDPDGRGLNDHWQKTSQALLVGCILHLLYKARHSTPGTVNASLAGVDAMLADPNQPTNTLWEEMKSYPHKAEKAPDENTFNSNSDLIHPAVAKSAQDMIDRPEQERGSVLSTAKSYLALFRDPVVAANTSKSGFKIKDIVNTEGQAVSLYIVTQPADKTRLRPLVRILVNMICRVLADKMTFEKTEAKPFSFREKIVRLLHGQSIRPQGASRRAKSGNKHKLLMMMDEFPSLGKLEIVQESLAFLAGYGIRFYLICQDLSQLRSEEIGYGKDEAISSNCHIQNAFQPNKLETAEYLSKLTGTTTVVKEQLTVSGRRMDAILGNVSRSLQEVSRPLMTPDECMRMPPPEKKGELMLKGGSMLLYMAGFPAIFGKQMPWFLDPVFVSRAQIDPPDTSETFGEQQAAQVTFEETKTIPQEQPSEVCPVDVEAPEEQPCAVPSD